MWHAERGLGCVRAGMVFTVCCEPYLQSEYGADYVSDSPVKLLDRLLHGQRQIPDEQVRGSPAAECLLLSWALQREKVVARIGFLLALLVMGA